MLFAKRQSAALPKAISDPRRQRLIEQEAAIEEHLSRLHAFLQAAPRIQEESRFIVPSLDEPTANHPVIPHRSEFARIQRLNYYHGIKLILNIVLFLGAAIWLVDRLMTYLP